MSLLWWTVEWVGVVGWYCWVLQLLVGVQTAAVYDLRLWCSDVVSELMGGGCRVGQAQVKRNVLPCHTVKE